MTSSILPERHVSLVLSWHRGEHGSDLHASQQLPETVAVPGPDDAKLCWRLSPNHPRWFDIQRVRHKSANSRNLRKRSDPPRSYDLVKRQATLVDGYSDGSGNA
jgi:hypothetical protein